VNLRKDHSQTIPFLFFHPVTRCLRAARAPLASGMALCLRAFADGAALVSAGWVARSLHETEPERMGCRTPMRGGFSPAGWAARSLHETKPERMGFRTPMRVVACLIG
jgi:hypothetical protein